MTRRDARDTRGSLDIASVRHRYGTGANVTHLLRTYKPFASRLLRKGNAVAFMFDTNDDLNPDRALVVAWFEGRLRAAFIARNGRLLGLYAASRPDSRSVAVSIPATLLGEKLGRYRWLAATNYKGKKVCRKECTDMAPDSGPLLHRMWELKALTVAVSGSGTIRADRAPIACPTRCAAQVRAGTTVKLTAAPAEGSVFTGWAGACTGTGDCVVTMDSAKTVTATFVPAQTLSVSIAGPGAVIVNPPNATCSSPGPCVHRYASGTTVTLTVSLGANEVFDGWTGDCAGANPVCTLTMNGNKTAVAHTRVSTATRVVAVGPRTSVAARRIRILTLPR